MDTRKIGRHGARNWPARMARACFALAGVLLVVSIAAWLDRTRDNALLRADALSVTGKLGRPSDAIVALNHWVYGHKGFAKNPNYFLIKALGPSPIQVLNAGGDCADKSRLLSAMLAQIGISSGLVMIYPCSGCNPIHSVVEAVYENGRMVVDPTWDIDYPVGDGRYRGVQDLAGTTYGRARLQEMQNESSAGMKIREMPFSEATFDDAKAINWNKNFETKSVASVLRTSGVRPEIMLRPRFLEDPQLAVAIFVLLLSGGMFAIGLAIRRYSARQASLLQLSAVAASAN